MTTYIAGPMTGIPEFNYPAFHYAATVLRAQGQTVINPAELHGDDDTGGDHTWEWYLRAALKAVLECDEIVLLPRWEQSRGARLEKLVAEQLGMRVTKWGDRRVAIKVGEETGRNDAAWPDTVNSLKARDIESGYDPDGAVP